MTLADIDNALAHWESRLASAAHNLFDLQNDPTYQCLTGTSGAPKTILTGVTANRVGPALDNISTLFQCFDLLRCTIDRAVQIRRELPSMFGADQKLRDIQQTLFSKSVRLPTDQIPMSHRSLLTGADDQGCISPEELLTSMVKAFENARDAVLSVDAAWRNLGDTLGEATRRLNALRIGIEPLEEAEVHELEGVDHAIGLRRAQVQSDPLGTTLDLQTTVVSVLARIENAVAERAMLRHNVETRLRDARGILAQWEDLRNNTAASCEETKDKITGAGNLPAIPTDQLDRHRTWLETLEKRYEQGLLRPIAVGVNNWNSSARDCVSALEKVYAANRAPLDLRNELRGRLNALKAKANAYAQEEDDELTSIAREAEQLLFTRPTPIDRADALVTRYQSLLNQRLGGARG